MSRKERRAQELNRHYEALTKLALLCGVENPDGKKLSTKLRNIETWITKPIEDYANGTLKGNLDELTSDAKTKVQTLFNNNLKGFFINTDPRGYALKIKDDIMRSEYRDLGLQTDWGGYGLLAPEITGK